MKIYMYILTYVLSHDRFLKNFHDSVSLCIPLFSFTDLFLQLDQVRKQVTIQNMRGTQKASHHGARKTTRQNVLT